MERANGNHPSAIELRREVGFACPIPGCEEMILTYHHFDPPWRDRKHNDVAGMIALCEKHHGEAERGAWTNAELRDFKACASQRVKQRVIAAPASKARSIVRIGGNYALTGGNILAVNKCVVLSTQLTSEGKNIFSLYLQNERNKVVLEVMQNTVSVDTKNVYDIHFRVNTSRFVVRSKAGRTELDVEAKRLSEAEFANLVRSDRGRSTTPRVHPPDIRMEPIPTTEEQLLEDARTVKDQDGLINVLNVRSGRFWFAGRSLTIDESGIISNKVRMSLVYTRSEGEMTDPAYSHRGDFAADQTYKVLPNDFDLNDALVLHAEKLCQEQGDWTAREIVAPYTAASAKYPALFATAAALSVRVENA